jgi:hypothetical protein
MVSLHQSDDGTKERLVWLVLQGANCGKRQPWDALGWNVLQLIGRTDFFLFCVSGTISDFSIRITKKKNLDCNSNFFVVSLSSVRLATPARAVHPGAL